MKLIISIVMFGVAYFVGYHLTRSTLAPKGPVVSADTEWHPYTNDDGTMSADFPEAPQLKEINIPSPLGRLETTMIVFEGRDLTFNLGKITYPVDPSQYNVDKGLEGAIAGAKTMTGGEIESVEDIFTFGLPGKEAVIKSWIGNAARVQVFIDRSGPTLYTCQVVGPLDELHGAAAEKFFDSFAIRTNWSPPVQRLAQPVPLEDKPADNPSAAGSARTLTKHLAPARHKSSRSKSGGPMTVTNPYFTSD